MIRIPVAQGVGAAAEPLGIAVFGGGIVSIVGAFTASATLGVFVLVYLGVWLALVGSAAGAGEKARQQGRRGDGAYPHEDIGFALLAGSALCVLLGGLLVFILKWLPFFWVGWAATILYVAGFLIGMIGILPWLMKLLGLLLGAVMASVMLLVPPPEQIVSGDDGWTVELTVVNEEGSAISSALAACAISISRGAQGLRFLEEISAKQTNYDGQATFSFSEQTRLKAVTCVAWKPKGGSVDGYEREYLTVPQPFQSVDVPLQIQLTRRISAHS